MAQMPRAFRASSDSGAGFLSHLMSNGGDNVQGSRPISEISINGENPSSSSDDARVLFSKLKRYPALRKSLASVNLARSYKYGSKPFGQKKWYKDDFDVVTGLRSNEARRKFRFGLKTNIEFLIQLDLENLKECLTKAGFPLESTLPENSPKILSNGSFLDLMRKANQKNFNEFCKIFNRV